MLVQRLAILAALFGCELAAITILFDAESLPTLGVPGLIRLIGPLSLRVIVGFVALHPRPDPGDGLVDLGTLVSERDDRDDTLSVLVASGGIVREACRPQRRCCSGDDPRGASMVAAEAEDRKRHV